MVVVVHDANRVVGYYGPLADCRRARSPAAEDPDGPVRAIDEDAIGFWRRRGFLASPTDPYLPFRSLPDIEASLKAADQS